MAATENLVISKIIEKGSLDEAMKGGIKPIHFAAEWEEVYSWILDYNLKHGVVPTLRAFNMQYGHIDLPDTTGESFSGLFEELLDTYRTAQVVNAVSTAMCKLDKDDVTGAIADLQQGLQKASYEASRLRDLDVISNWEERYAKYEEMRKNPNALRGIPTGFLGLDLITHGLRPQQFIVMAGEPKRGKSLFALIMADSAHRSGRKPFFVSFEMSIEEQAARLDALASHVNYDNILSGKLSPQEMSRIHQTLMQRKNMQPFMFSEDTSSLTTLSAISGKCQEYTPDLLVIDGMYLMDDENGEPKGSPQALTNISRGLKRIAQRFDIPLVGTTQVLGWKLGNKKTRAITGDSLGYTSAYVQDTDLLLGVERHPDIQDQSIIRVVEARTAPRAEIHVQWDWKTMEFAEIEHDDDVVGGKRHYDDT